MYHELRKRGTSRIFLSENRCPLFRKMLYNQDNKVQHGGNQMVRRHWLTVFAGATAALGALLLLPVSAPSQQPKEVKVALIVPLSGPWARQGDLLKKGADMAIDDINNSGGIKSLGGAKMKLIV